MTDFGFADFTQEPYVLDARSGAGHAVAWPHGRQLTAGVVLLSRSCDSELDAVGTLLARANIPSVRIDADQLEAAEVILDPASRQVQLNGRRIAPTVTWIRHFAATAIARTRSGVADQLARESWAAAASGLAQMSPVTIGADLPGILEQQRLAARHQVTTPRTVLTNDLARAAQLIGTRRLVVKAAHQHFVEAEPGLLSGVFPVMVDGEQLAGQAPSRTPVIVQEYVEHDTELRVYFIDGRLECFEVGKTSPADPWLAPDRVTARLAATPPGVAADVRRLAEVMSLRFAAFDFLLRDGCAIFLEANPDGDWRWLEAKAGQWPVTSAAGRMLGGLHHAHCSGSQPFNLLAFLSGGPA